MIAEGKNIMWKKREGKQYYLPYYMLGRISSGEEGIRNSISGRKSRIKNSRAVQKNFIQPGPCPLLNALPAICADLCDLDEPAALVLLHVQIEPLALQHQVPGRQVTLQQ